MGGSSSAGTATARPVQDESTEVVSGIVVHYSAKRQAIQDELEGIYRELQSFRRQQGIPAPTSVSSRMVRGYTTVRQPGVDIVLGDGNNTQASQMREVESMASKVRSGRLVAGNAHYSYRYASAIRVEFQAPAKMSKGEYSAVFAPWKESFAQFASSRGLTWRVSEFGDSASITLGR